MLLTACDGGPTTPADDGGNEPATSTETVSFTGRVVTADGGGLPEMVVRVVGADDTVTADVTSDGLFSVQGKRFVGDSATLVIEEQDLPGSAYLPSLKSFGPDEETTSLVGLLIPSRVVVPSGRWAGEVVEVSLQAAVAPDNQAVENGLGTFYFLNRWVEPGLTTRDVVDPGRSLWTHGWAEDRFPLPLYFEPPGTTDDGQERVQVSEADSVAIWSAIDDMEDRLGMDLFGPAPKESLPADSLPLEGGRFQERRLFAVGLEMVPALASPGHYNGFAGADPACFHPFDNLCERFGQGALVEAGVRVSGFFAVDPRDVRWLVQHELIHALGFGHSCFRPSVMAACRGPYPGVSYEGGDANPHATAYDAAYLVWHRMIHAKTLEVRPHLGIVEALDGERVRLLGRPPVPLATRCRWGDPSPECLQGA